MEYLVTFNPKATLYAWQVSTRWGPIGFWERLIARFGYRRDRWAPVCSSATFAKCAEFLEKRAREELE